MGRSFRNLGLSLLIIGSLIRKPSIGILGGILTATAVISWVLSRISMTDITYTRTLTPRRAFIGDRVLVGYRISNAKPIPVRLWCEENIPAEWDCPGDKTVSYSSQSRATLVSERSLGAYATSAWQHHFDCESRGLFTFGPVTLRSQDPFGLYPTAEVADKTDALVVYPRILPVDDAACQDLFPFGVRRRPSWVYQDPLEVKTSRRYSWGDSAKSIDWKTTAKTGSLMTRVFDATFDKRVVICLNLSTGAFPWGGVNPLIFENLVSAAASVAWDLSGRGLPVGLCTNGVSKAEEGDNYLAQRAPASGEAHLREILTCLAGLGYYVFGDFAKASSLPYVSSQGTYPLVVTSVVDRGIVSFLNAHDASSKTALLILEETGQDPEERRAFIDQARLICQDRVFVTRLEGGWRDADRLTILPTG